MRTFRCAVCKNYYNSEALSAPPRCPLCDKDEVIATLRADLDIAESRKAEAFQRLRAERDSAESERGRLASLLSSVARMHGCPEGIQKRIRAEGVTQDPSAEWSPYRLRTERDEAGSVLGAVCMVGTLAPDEECEVLDNHQHAAVQTAMRIRWERDAARGALRHAEGEVASLRVVATAAREYLMRSVPDPNVGTAAEDTLREALADLEMTG